MRDVFGKMSPWGVLMKASLRRNAIASVLESANGTVSLKVKQVRPDDLKPPFSWMVPYKPFKTTALDRLGTEVWRLCDGTRRVGDIVDDFAVAHSLTFHEARVAVTGYLQTLVQRGVLSIEEPVEPVTEKTQG